MATREQIKQTIKSHGLTGDAATVLAALQTKTVQRVRPAGERTNFSGLTTLLGEDAVNGFLRKLKAAAKATDSPFLETAIATLANEGFDFDAPPMQGMLQKLEQRGVLTKAEADVLRGVDQWQESPLEVATGERGATATVEDVTVALAEIAAEVPPVFDRKTILFMGNIDHMGQARVSLRVSEASESGQQGGVVRQIVSADADNDETLKPLVDLIRTLAEG